MYKGPYPTPKVICVRRRDFNVQGEKVASILSYIQFHALRKHTMGTIQLILMMTVSKFVYHVLTFFFILARL